MSEIEMTPPTSIDDSSKDIFKDPVYRQTSIAEYSSPCIPNLYKWRIKMEDQLPSCSNCLARKYNRCKYYDWKDKQIPLTLTIDARVNSFNPDKIKCIKRRAYLHYHNLGKYFDICEDARYHDSMNLFWKIIKEIEDKNRLVDSHTSLNRGKIPEYRQETLV